MRKNTLPMTPEMLANVLTDNLDSDESYIFTNDPMGFVLGKLRVSPALTMKVVVNRDDRVHLALPYYDSLHRDRSALSNDDVARVGGGVGGLGRIESEAMTAVLRDNKITDFGELREK